MSVIPASPGSYPGPSHLSNWLPADLAEPEPSLGRLLRTLWRRRLIVAGVLMPGLALTALALALWPRTYTATAALVVNYEVTDPLNGKELPVGQVSSYIATQVELLQTPAVLRAVAERLALLGADDASRAPPGGDGTPADSTRADSTPADSTRADRAAMQVARALQIVPSPRGSQMIYVSYSARLPSLAAAGANAVVDLYKAQDAERAAGPPGERLRRHGEELAALKAKVDAAQQAATRFQQRHGLIDDGTRTDVDLLRLASLDERLLAARHARQAAELQAAQDPATSDGVMASTQAQALKAQLGVAELRLSQLERHYTPAHPDVREARVQVDEARAALAAVIRTYRDHASAGRQVAQRLEQGLQRESAEQRGQVLARSRLQDEAAAYRLEVASALAVYQRALDGEDQIRFASTGGRSNVSIVSRATPPLQASRPRLLAGLALGSAASLLLAVVAAVLWDRAHPRLGDREDVEREFGPSHDVTVLGEFGRVPNRGAA
ncbi:GumC family protein [Leptothrix discophora]|uniref:Wzz/FepE/Etk N-terminal domain-containing protein n=1 Tax=Leptothrix discophora TaxID=89 RepID=A0ABT9G8K7_LEPDI|nr:Wzz/FepE/Etk N-terminal domain-containing protein [Leptothrix discophora]MDP4302813.1 Wzz/FepE/Etk N-terminal domain-containing protein [Leptothrix discophora]